MFVGPQTHRKSRYVEVSRGGWDTHDNNFEAVASLYGYDKALCPPRFEMRGLLKETMVVLPLICRTPKINQEMEETTGHNGSLPPR